MSKPNEIVATIEVKDCCNEALDNIEGVLDLGRVLTGLLAASPFILLFGAKGPTPNSTISFVRRDFDLWAESVKASSEIARIKCRQICQFEMIKHRGGELNKFWRAMERSFI